MILITDGTFSMDQVTREMKTGNRGAIVRFIGLVRGEPGVDGLDVEVYEGMAERELEKIEDEAIERYQLDQVRIIH